MIISSTLGQLPGVWLQVERTLTSARVVGIDLNPIAPLDGVETIEGDLNDPEVQEKVRSMLGVVNVVVCDAAPKLSGHKSYDQARIIELNEQALDVCLQGAKTGREFCSKIFPGHGFSRTLCHDKRTFLFRENLHHQINPEREHRALYRCKEFCRLNRS